MPSSPTRLSVAVGAAVAVAIAAYGARMKAGRRGLRYLPREASAQRDPYGLTAMRPSEIPQRAFPEILRRVFTQSVQDNISIVAAGVAFYSLLSLFPALSALVSLYGLIADVGDVNRQVAALDGVVPPEIIGLLEEQLKAVSQEGSRLGFGLGLGVLLALWTARAGTTSIMTALNIAYEEKEKRSFVVLNLQALGLTAGLVLAGLTALSLVAILPIALDILPIPTSWAWVLAVARWVVLALLLSLILAALYRFAPSRRKPRWDWVTPGALLATTIWLVASAGFSWYVANFGSYNKTYGSLAAVVILLFWFYIGAYVVLLGAELNAELERQTARDTTRGPERPLGKRGARMADMVAHPRALEDLLRSR